MSDLGGQISSKLNFAKAGEVWEIVKLSGKGQGDSPQDVQAEPAEKVQVIEEMGKVSEEVQAELAQAELDNDVKLFKLSL